jgi:hypothetical protein
MHLAGTTPASGNGIGDGVDGFDAGFFPRLWATQGNVEIDEPEPDAGPSPPRRPMLAVKINLPIRWLTWGSDAGDIFESRRERQQQCRPSVV